ncbi:MAG: GtrA family protein [Pseudomonadota bacterium]
MLSNRLNALEQEFFRVARFVVVGLFNTAIGYGVILACLYWGAGDYAANVIGFALGLPIAYALHRGFTFRVARRASPAEAFRYLLAFLIAFGVNLGVVATGRAIGYVEHPLVQLFAICTYAGVFYLLSRLIVFPSTETVADPRN